MKSKLLFLVFVLFLNTGINAQCWKNISSGYFQTIAIKSDGTLWTWGQNSYGQLGDGTIIDRNTPKQIGISINWQSVYAGYGHTIGIKTDGTLWAWGLNSSGQLGDGTIINKSIPVQIGNDSNWQSISCGYNHTVAIKNDGTIWAWGKNQFGQLGIGSKINKNTPTQIGIDENWKMISAGDFHTLAIKTDGTLWAWGFNDNGQLGDNTLIDKLSPINIDNSTDWLLVSGGGDFFTVAIKTNGTLWAWGWNFYGQLGDGTNLDKIVPTQIGIETNWKSIFAAVQHNLAIKKNGTLWAWGRNDFGGELGDGTLIDKNYPIQIGTSSWESISAKAHSIALNNDGTLWSWGYNKFGALGDGTNIDKNTPTQISCASLGLEKTSVENDSFLVYPNPVNKILYFQNDANQSVDKIIITNLNGKKILEQKGTNNRQINVQNLQIGMYLLQVFSEGKIFQTKFIKQ